MLSLSTVTTAAARIPLRTRLALVARRGWGVHRGWMAYRRYATEQSAALDETRWTHLRTATAHSLTADDWSTAIGYLIRDIGLRVVVTSDHWGDDHYGVEDVTSRDTRPTLDTLAQMRADSPLAAASGVQVRYRVDDEPDEPAEAPEDDAADEAQGAAVTTPMRAVQPSATQPSTSQPSAAAPVMSGVTHISIADLIDEATRAHLAAIATAVTLREVEATDTVEMEVTPVC